MPSSDRVRALHAHLAATPVEGPRPEAASGTVVPSEQVEAGGLLAVMKQCSTMQQFRPEKGTKLSLQWGGQLPDAAEGICALVEAEIINTAGATSIDLLSGAQQLTAVATLVDETRMTELRATLEGASVVVVFAETDGSESSLQRALVSLALVIDAAPGVAAMLCGVGRAEVSTPSSWYQTVGCGLAVGLFGEGVAESPLDVLPLLHGPMLYEITVFDRHSGFTLFCPPFMDDIGKGEFQPMPLLSLPQRVEEMPVMVMSNEMVVGDEISIRIFEPRYRKLVREALDSDGCFLMVAAPDETKIAMLMQITKLKFVTVDYQSVITIRAKAFVALDPESTLAPCWRSFGLAVGSGAVVSEAPAFPGTMEEAVAAAPWLGEAVERWNGRGGQVEGLDDLRRVSYEYRELMGGLRRGGMHQPMIAAGELILSLTAMAGRAKVQLLSCPDWRARLRAVLLGDKEALQ